jgi:imidazolonepropionase
LKTQERAADDTGWLAREEKTVKRYAMSLLIRHARVLTLALPETGAATLLIGGRKARRGAALKELGVIARGDVLVVDGKIAAVGAELAVPEGAEVIEADGRVLMPGFVDCHTHACWAGDRLGEWEEDLRGVAPAEILKKGGGIQATVRAVKEATRKQLASGLRVRLDAMLRGGTTTVEVKSGYGLTIDGETKMLHAIARAAQEFPGTVVPTALLGQTVDGDVATFTRVVVRELLPAVWHEFPGVAVDAVCAADAWPVEACVRLLERAGKHGLPLRVSADSTEATGMIAEALRLHLRSVDHLENASKADLLALAASDTFGVFTPGASFHAGGRYARAGAFAESGGLIALASDYSVASAPSHAMPFVIALAVRKSGLTVAEAIAATTVNAAAVLGLNDRGTIEVGQRADLILLRHRDERLLAHEIGGNPVELVVAGGKRVG